MEIAEFLGISVNELLFNYLLPFLIVFAILWGVLEILGVFNRKINTVLAFGITIAAAYGGAFTFLSQYLIKAGALVALSAFAIVFIIGSIRWAFGRTREYYYETGGRGKKLEKLYKEREKIIEKMKNARNEKDRRGLYNRLFQIEQEIRERSFGED